MKSLQICLLSAVLVIVASNPIPADEPVSTVAPLVSDVTPAVKVAPQQPVGTTVTEAVTVTEVPAIQKSLPIDLDKIPEPQALPSKKEEPAAPVKTEEKKREVPVEQSTVKKSDEVAPVEGAPVAVAQPEQVTGKSLPETPVKELVTEAVTPKVEQPQPAESVKSINVEKPVEVLPTIPSVPAAEVVPAVAAVVPEAKQADIKQAIESTVVPVVPSGLASEKKIDAEAPVAIVSENVQQPAAIVEPEQKSALPVPAEQVQAAPEQPQPEKPIQEVAQALAQTQPQERSAQDPTAVPILPAKAAEPTVAASDVSSSVSSEKKVESSEESSSSEESKESPEEIEKKIGA